MNYPQCSPKYFITGLILCFIAIPLTHCQRLVTLTEIVKVKNITHTTQGQVRVMIPETIPGKQQVLNIEYNIKPNTVHKVKSYTMAKWDLSRSEITQNIRITTTLLISRFDWLEAQTNPLPINGLLLEPYLRDEPNFRKNNKNIQKKARELKGPTDMETLENIFQFVVDHLEYHVFDWQNRGASKALRQQKGDCTEYSELMISLCRASGIPARIVTGKTLKPSFKRRIGAHNWVEVYIPAYGWVAFDPTHADGRTSTSFERMENKYVYYSNERHVELFSHDAKKNPRLKVTYQLDWVDHSAPVERNAYLYYSQAENQRAKASLDTLIAIRPMDYELRMMRGIVKAREHDFQSALMDLQLAVLYSKNEQEKNRVLYAFVKYFALREDKELALSFLDSAIQLGFDKYEFMSKDTDLQSLWENPEFKNRIIGIPTKD